MERQAGALVGVLVALGADAAGDPLAAHLAARGDAHLGALARVARRADVRRTGASRERVAVVTLQALAGRSLGGYDALGVVTAQVTVTLCNVGVIGSKQPVETRKRAINPENHKPKYNDNYFRRQK